VPKSDDGHGRITIDFGTGHPKTFDLSRLLLEPYTAIAGLDSTEFGAKWISPEVRPNYRHAVEERISGLDRTLVNVFATSGQKNKQRVDGLTWGNSYYFVWHANVLTDIHRSLSVLPLAPEADWRCALITLPDEEDADTKTWIDEFVGLSFNQQRRLFGLVLPAPCGLDVVGRPVVPDTGKLLFGLNLGHSDDDGGRKFSVSTGKENATVSISSSGRHLFEVEASLGRSTLGVQLDDTPLPSLTPYVEDSNEYIQGVTLEVRTLDGQASRIGLHQVGGAEVLRHVREGRAELVGLSSPRDAGAEIRWRTPPLVGWQRLVLFKSPGSTFLVAASSDELLKIKSVLRDRSLDVQIDVGPFGTFYDAGIAKKSERQSLVLSEQTRRRLIWICKSARKYTDSGKIPVDRLSDVALAAAFESLAIPPELTAHKTFLESELRHAIPQVRP
jgi:hypothetical protein